MAVLRTLPRALAGRKFSAQRNAITGTGAIVSGLTTIDPGSVQLTGTNSAATIPTNVVAGATSITGGSVSLVVVALAAAANAVSAVSESVDLFCTGV
jgi:hypothetical protein